MKRNPLAVVLTLSAVFFIIFLVISGVMFFRSSGSKGGDPVGGGLFSEGSVAVVELNGVITDSKKVLKRLERLEESDEVKAVVMRINSPGGAVAPSQEIYQAVKNFKKPVVSSMGSVAASGGYYVACGTRKIFANPGTITGSIGVIMEFANLEKLYEWAKVRRFSIKTGKFKDAGAEYRDMSVEERALLQGMVDDVLLQFKEAVAEGRKLSMDQVTKVADGRIFSGSQAKQAKLVDELGTLKDAINEAAKMAKLKGKPNVVYPDKKKRGFLEYLLEDRPGDDEAESGTRLSPLAAVALQALGLRPADEGAMMGAGSLREQITGLAPGIYWIWSGAR